MCMCSRFKILCAGGDGTVAWILGTIHKLQLRPIPQASHLRCSCAVHFSIQAKDLSPAHPSSRMHVGCYLSIRKLTLKPDLRLNESQSHIHH